MSHCHVLKPIFDVTLLLLIVNKTSQSCNCHFYVLLKTIYVKSPTFNLKTTQSKIQTKNSKSIDHR